MPSASIRIPYSRAPSSLHYMTLDSIQERFRYSKERMRNAYPDYDRREDQFRAFTSDTAADQLRADRRSLGHPQYTNVLIPYSYAEAMTAVTYAASVWYSRSPVFQWLGNNAEAHKNKLAVDSLHNWQMTKGRNMMQMYVWLMDAYKLGLGTIGNYWAQEFAQIPQILAEPPDAFGKMRTRKETMTFQMYAGNKLFNVHPKDCFPDPRVPIARAQEGEFFGHVTKVPWNTIAKGAADGIYQNVDELANHRRIHYLTEIKGQGSDVLPDQDGSYLTTRDLAPVEILEMYIELIPEDWKLGDSKYPERWVFTVASNEVILSARPLGSLHNRFPFFTIEPEFDGYSFHSRSPLDVVKPLTDVMDWLFNSHMWNVRKAMNDKFLVDPSRVEMDDVMRPLAGGYIRLKPSAYGRGDPHQWLTQLNVHDVTQGHIADTQHVQQILQRTTARNDSFMGIPVGGRRTATDVRQTNQFATNRSKVTADFMHYQGFESLAQTMLQNSQQYFDAEQAVRIVGPISIDDDPFITVTPEAIAGEYDFLPADTNAPIDRYAMAEMWQQLMNTAAQVPGLGPSEGPDGQMMPGSLDFANLFVYVARLMGATEVDHFVNFEVAEDEVVQNQFDAGNVVPLNAALGEAAGV